VNILNKYKNVTIAGEIYNLGLFEKLNSDKEPTLGLFQIFNNKSNKIKGKFSFNPLYLPKNTNYHSFFNKPDKFYENFKKLRTLEERIKYIMPKNEIIGCKILANAKNFRWFTNFKNLFPMFKVIVLVRENTDELRDSMKRAGWGGWKTIDLKKENEEYKKIYDEYKDSMYLLSYEDILARNKRFKGLFNFMGLKYSEDNVRLGSTKICSYASSMRN
jgi:hypothetical protein